MAGTENPPNILNPYPPKGGKIEVHISRSLLLALVCVSIPGENFKGGGLAYRI